MARGKTVSKLIKQIMGTNGKLLVTFVDHVPVGEHYIPWIRWLGKFIRERVGCDLEWDEVNDTWRKDLWRELCVRISTLK
jgi:hypothetical protein